MIINHNVPSRRDFLSRYLDGFDNLPKRTQNLAVKCLFCNNRHRVWPEAKSFNRSWLTHPTVGADNRRFERMNNKLGLFYTNDKFSPGHFSKPYWLTDKARNAIVGYVSEIDPREIMKIVEGADLQIDVMGVWEYMNSISDPERITKCAELIANVPEENFLRTEYMELNCGRKVAVGYNFQNMPKWLREIVLKGWWDYDFKNCHYVIASTLGDFPTINQYVEDSDAIREELAKELGCDIKPVKYSLLSLLYGAKRKPTPNSAIYDYLGKEQAQHFVDNPFVKHLCDDIDGLLEVVKERLYHCPQIVQKNDHSAAAQYLMMYEASMLEVATLEVEDPLLMYDGFMCKDRQDRGYIEKRVRNATKIPVTVTEEQIGE